MNFLRGITIVVVLALIGIVRAASAAHGDMGTGIPNFGTYGAFNSGTAAVWSLGSAAIAFPAGCSAILLTPTTMGADGFKIAIATMMMARASGKMVRFYAHAERDGGCGVDYVQMLD